MVLIIKPMWHFPSSSSFGCSLSLSYTNYSTLLSLVYQKHRFVMEDNSRSSVIVVSEALTVSRRAIHYTIHYVELHDSRSQFFLLFKRFFFLLRESNGSPFPCFNLLKKKTGCVPPKCVLRRNHQTSEEYMGMVVSRWKIKKGKRPKEKIQHLKRYRFGNRFLCKTHKIQKLLHNMYTLI